MFDLSIVQSDTYCLPKISSGVDVEAAFLRFLEKQSEQVILSSVEVDSEETGIYRVWRDSQLLGNFQREIDNGLWISQPCNYKLTPRFETSNDAVMFIVEMNALAAA